MLSVKLKDKNLGENFECSGEWWFPDDENENRFCGTLAFVEGRDIMLDLLRPIKHVSNDILSIRKISAPKIILGLTSQGEKVTLFDCFEKNTSLHFAGISASLFKVKAVFVGVHFARIDDIKFKMLKIRYSHLEEWVGIGGLSIDETGAIKREQPKSIQSVNVEDYEVSISVTVSTSFKNGHTKKMLLEDRASINIKASEEMNLEKCLNIVYYIQNFLSLMTMEPIYPLTIDGYIDEEDSRVIPVRFLYKLLGTKKSSGEVYQDDMFFPYEKISDIFEDLLASMIKDPNLKPIYNSFFADFYTPPPFAETRFLSLVQAIEGFHRRAFEDENYMPEEKYKESIYPRFLKTIDEIGLEDKSFETSLKDGLQWGYELSLRTQLKKLLKEYGDTFKDIFITSKEVVTGKETSAFIDYIVTTRNYYTHFSKKLEHKAAKGTDLVYLNGRLEIFFIILLLNRIGIPQNYIDEVIRHHSQNNYKKFGYLRKRSKMNS